MLVFYNHLIGVKTDNYGTLRCTWPASHFLSCESNKASQAHNTTVIVPNTGDTG